MTSASEIRRQIRDVKINLDLLLSTFGGDACPDRVKGYGRQLDSLQAKLRSMKGGPISETFFGDAMNLMEKGS